MCILPQCKKCGGVYKIFAITVATIFIYWLFLLHTNKNSIPENDIMNRIIFEFPYLENCCSMWPLSHFILFLIIGFLFPDCDAVAIGGGVLWEMAEVGAFYVFKSDKRQAVMKNGNRIEYSQNWWMGSFKDIFFNIAGFYVGKAISRTISKKEELDGGRETVKYSTEDVKKSVTPVEFCCE
jgi:hypothetical protein